MKIKQRLSTAMTILRGGKISSKEQIVGVVSNEALSKIVPGTDLYDIFTGIPSDSGVVVNEKSIRTVSAVYACVNLISGAIASMPIPIYEKTTEGRKKATQYDDLLRLINVEPTENFSAAVFWEYVIGSLLLNGDAFVEIKRKSRLSPNPVALLPHHKDTVQVVKKNGTLYYVISDDNGLNSYTLHQDDVLHIPGPGFDGLNGQSQITSVLKNSGGVSLASDKYAASFYKNGARPDFGIEVPGNPTSEQQQMMRDTWDDRHQGIDNANRPFLMSGGVKIHTLQMNPEDSQLLETRKFQVEDVARIFGVPPHMIGQTEKTSSFGSGVEQMGINFVKFTLQRHFIKIQQEINRKLLPKSGEFYCEFLTAGLERGDIKTRNESYRIALGRAGEPAWMRPSEVRKMENLPPDDELDNEAKIKRENAP